MLADDLARPDIRPKALRDNLSLLFNRPTTTPLAAGVAALVLQKHPDWTAAQVLQRLRDTCDMPAAFPIPNDRYGHGRINAYRAVYEPEASDTITQAE